MILTSKDISKVFDGKLILDNINFTLKTGEITGLVGRNGSGKTTLLKILSKILDPISGTVLVDDVDLFKNPKLIENIAYLPDSFDFFIYDTGNKAMDYYEIIYPKFNRKFVEEEAKKINIPLDQTIRSLSKGQSTLLGLLIILGTKANILLIDEALDGMDVINKELVLQYLIDAAENDHAILISSHQLDELQGITDNILYLSIDGKVENIKDNRDKPLNKVQIVVSESIPEDILKDSLLRFQLGRVYTVLMEGPEEEILHKLIRKEIVQFDILPLKLEDYFYWEKEKENIKWKIL